jgi:hypothetical protein
MILNNECMARRLMRHDSFIKTTRIARRGGWLSKNTKFYLREILKMS